MGRCCSEVSLFCDRRRELLPAEQTRLWNNTRNAGIILVVLGVAFILAAVIEHDLSLLGTKWFRMAACLVFAYTSGAVMVVLGSLLLHGLCKHRYPSLVAGSAGAVLAAAALAADITMCVVLWNGWLVIWRMLFDILALLFLIYHVFFALAYTRRQWNVEAEEIRQQKAQQREPDRAEDPPTQS